MKYRIFSFLIIATLLASCKKSVQVPNEENPTGDVTLHIHSFLGQKELEEYGVTDSLEDNRKISVDLAELEATDIQLIQLDGTIIDAPINKFLKTLKEETYSLGKVSLGNYQAVRFKVSTLNFQGKIDTTTSKTGELISFNYKLAAPLLPIEITLNQNFLVLKDGSAMIHLGVDYAKLFEGVDVTNSDNLVIVTSKDNEKAVVKVLTTNIGKAVRLN
jgi:hypothetical protein